MAAEFKRPYYADRQLDEAFSKWVEMYCLYGDDITAYWIRRQMKNIRHLSKSEKIALIEEATVNEYRSIVTEDQRDEEYRNRRLGWRK